MARVRVSNVDGEELKVRQARSLSKKLCVMGLFGVPFLWVVHLWYFWPEVHKENPDPYIKRSKSQQASTGNPLLRLLGTAVSLQQNQKEKHARAQSLTLALPSLRLSLSSFSLSQTLCGP